MFIKHVNMPISEITASTFFKCSKVHQHISIISSRDICSSTDRKEEAPPSTAIFFNNSIEVRTT